MKNRLNIFIFLLLGAVMLSFNSTSAIESSDAIAIRILQNPNHYSPLRWYKENIKIPGSPQSLIVDGYDAIRDGRTVYVAAANIKPEGGNSALYTNIYVISFNQDAQVNTVDIFGQLLANWKFNINLSEPGICSKKNNPCLSSNECSVGEYCTSDKAKVVREVKRFADLADINSALEKYKTKNGYCPKLASGSYLPNKSISTWPSWQQTLGKELGMTLPIDPINKLGRCKADEIENKKYDSNTCWDQHNVKLAFASDPQFIFPDKSFVYVYRASSDGKDCTVYSTQETDYSCPPGEICKGNEVTAEPQVCNSFTYNCGVCQPNNTKTCTVTASFPVNCVGGNPSLIQTCTNPSPACNYTYDNWGPCQPDGTQTRTFTSTPVGCVGTPVTSQACTYTPPPPSACNYTYDNWGACQPDGTQTRTFTSTPAGCVGTPVTSQTCTYTPPPPPACTYTYDNWGACQPDGTQTRTFTSTPAGCVGTPVTSQTCTISSCNNGSVEEPELCDFGVKNGTGIGCSATCQPENNVACLASSNICCLKSYTVAAKGVKYSATGLPASNIVMNFYNDPNPNTARCFDGSTNTCSLSPSQSCNYNSAARGAVLAGTCTTDANGDCTLASPLPAGTYIKTGPTLCNLLVINVPFSVCYNKAGSSIIVNGECKDDDNDGFGVAGKNSGCPFLGDDCDDSDKLINPGAYESCGSTDNNCDGSTTSCGPVSANVLLPASNSATYNVGDSIDFKVLAAGHTDVKMRIRNSAGTPMLNPEYFLYDDVSHVDFIADNKIFGLTINTASAAPDNYIIDLVLDGTLQSNARTFKLLPVTNCIDITGGSSLATHGDPNNRLDIVFVGDGYTNINDLSLVARGLVNNFLTVEPWKTQKDKINFKYVNTLGSSGANNTMPSTAPAPPNGISLTHNYSWLNAVSCNADQVITLGNYYGRSSQCDAVAYLAMPGSGKTSALISGIINQPAKRCTIEFTTGAALHEFGHSYVGFLDEYNGSSAADVSRGISYYNNSFKKNCDTSSTCSKWPGHNCIEGCNFVYASPSNTFFGTRPPTSPGAPIYWRSIDEGIMNSHLKAATTALGWTFNNDYGSVNINEINKMMISYNP